MRWNLWPGRSHKDTPGPDLSTGDDASKAIERAHRSQVEATVIGNQLRIIHNEMRRELEVNHLAEDIRDVMRRRR